MPAVLVHGVPETPVIWGPLLHALQRTDTVTLQLPGFASPVPQVWTATKEEYLAWLVAELEAIGEPVDLVGHDWGGGLTFMLATTRPDLLRSWVCDAVGLFHPDYVWHDLAQIWQTPGAGEQYFVDGLAADPAATASLYVAFGMTPDVADALVAAMDEEMGRSILALYRSAIQPALAELGTQAEVAAARPGLVLSCGADPFVGDETTSATMATRMGAALERLPDAGHWWMLDSPAVAAAAIERFWAGV